MSDAPQQHAVPASAIQSSQPKSTIIKKSNARAKKGLGAKKTGGLGAQKVKKIDFSELEKSAEESDKAQMRLSISSSGSEKKVEEKLSESSRRLAYQDIETQEMRNNKKLARMDDRKKEQASRLGMGMGKVDGVSHSMKIMTINQEVPDDDRRRRGRYDDDDGDTFFDARPSRKSRWNDDADDSDDGGWVKKDFSYRQTFTNTDSTRSGSRDDEPPTYSIKPIEDSHKNISSVIVSNSPGDHESSRQRRSQPSSKAGVDLGKYSDAKAISSSMLFGEESQAEYEREQRMRNLEGRSAISSSDVFGSDSDRRPAYNSQLPDLGNLREGVRNVAGKMSSMVSGIATTIQDRYGT